MAPNIYIGPATTVTKPSLREKRFKHKSFFTREKSWLQGAKENINLKRFVQHIFLLVQLFRVGGAN